MFHFIFTVSNFNSYTLVICRMTRTWALYAPSRRKPRYSDLDFRSICGLVVTAHNSWAYKFEKTVPVQSIDIYSIWYRTGLHQLRELQSSNLDEPQTQHRSRSATACMPFLQPLSFSFPYVERQWTCWAYWLQMLEKCKALPVAQLNSWSKALKSVWQPQKRTHTYKQMICRHIR